MPSIRSEPRPRPGIRICTGTLTAVPVGLSLGAGDQVPQTAEQSASTLPVPVAVGAHGEVEVGVVEAAADAVDLGTEPLLVDLDLDGGGDALGRLLDDVLEAASQSLGVDLHLDLGGQPLGGRFDLGAELRGEACKVGDDRHVEATGLQALSHCGSFLSAWRP
ncbi:hypothetical protein [Streptomyces sp. SAI-119]|uniref:hypothetical protein n=1 Tax=Streptomyces sp. SAI-119 TaxID=2940541 RepID=UPI0024741880|nr:hypothetical protein [Streptomyces sp. SAI-119]